ncbi:MAG: hypothetical protein JO345_26610 [Streptosporangiaceae bacterium]|nr:hypothetical protein [Streptosporangiaceae bacterium]
MSILDDSDTALAPISYCEEAAWQEFVTDKFTFFNRLFEFKLTLPPGAGMGLARELITEITSRHEIFRTAFRPSGAGVVRQVLPSYEHQITEADEPDFTVHPDPAQTELTPADLVTIWVCPGPDGQKELLVDLNEMISDAWSSARVHSELLEMLASPGPREQAESTALYADFAREQRERTLPQELTGYWLSLLEDVAEPAYIRADGPDPSGDPAGERIIVFTDDATANLHALCSKYRLSSFMGAVALMNLVLAARSGERDITLGTIASVRAGRWADVQGNFSNLLLLRTIMPPDPSFEEILRLSRETVLGALAHKDVPQLRLTELLGKEPPLPPVRVHYLPRKAHHYDVLDSKPSGAVWNEYATFATWPIELGFGEDKNRRVSIWASYDPRLYTHATVARLLADCGDVLRLAGSEPQLTCDNVRERLCLEP